MDTVAAPRRGGAARSEAARIAVLEATTSLFAAKGYDHLTIEGIAAEAGVAKQTIYRWWPSKSAVVAEALIEGRLMPVDLSLPSTGDVRADVSAWLEGLFRFVDDPANSALVRSLIAAAAESPEIGIRLNDALGATSLLTIRLEEAVAAGELGLGAPVYEIVESLVGAVVIHALRREPSPPGIAGRLAAVLLR